MVLSLFANEFAEKIVNKYVNGKWLLCNLSDYYFYLEYFDEGGYGNIYKVMHKLSGEYLILKRSSKRDFVGHTLSHDSPFHNQEDHPDARTLDLQISREAAYTIVSDQELGGVALKDYFDDDDHYILILSMGGRSLENLAMSHRKKILDLLRYDSYKKNYFYKRYLTRISTYMIQVYHKVKKLHELGIHHNDLKPENILIEECPVSREIHATVIDFGVAKPVHLLPSRQTVVADLATTECGDLYTSFKGTLEYIPYEYATEGSYRAWDHTVWCFGIMLHFLCLMKYPFTEDEHIVHYELNYDQIRKLPPEFGNLILDCLHKDPEKRPRNLLERLKNLQNPEH